VVDEMELLGFTAQSSSGEDLPYFKKYRLDKKEFTAAQNKSYIRCYILLLIMCKIFMM
jgi:hypothetical protein